MASPAMTEPPFDIALDRDRCFVRVRWRGLWQVSTVHDYAAAAVGRATLTSSALFQRRVKRVNMAGHRTFGDADQVLVGLFAPGDGA